MQLQNLAVCAIATGLALRYFYVTHQWQANVEAEAQSRVRALQARIRPHFLFNSMNTIASLTRSNPKVAEQAIADLSDLFRASLREHRERIPLAHEIEIARAYERVERLRLGERLQVDWQVDGLPMDAKVPALILQPLLENAVYHGIEPLDQGGDHPRKRQAGRHAGRPDHRQSRVAPRRRAPARPPDRARQRAPAARAHVPRRSRGRGDRGARAIRRDAALSRRRRATREPARAGRRRRAARPRAALPPGRGAAGGGARRRRRKRRRSPAARRPPAARSRAARHPHAGHGRARGRAPPRAHARAARGHLHHGLRAARARGLRRAGGRLPPEAGAAGQAEGGPRARAAPHARAARAHRRGHGRHRARASPCARATSFGSSRSRTSPASSPSRNTRRCATPAARNSSRSR